jgi:Mrp family chromosome partitioning ATPase
MIAGRHGLNIALVDGNMENPSLCYQTNLELEVDWHEALARKLPLEEIAVHSVDDQVTLVPLLARLSAPQLNEQNMAKMLSELSQSFDLVVVDLGHMASSRNLVTSLGDLGAINAVVAVVDRRNNSADAIESCLRQIRQTGIASIGLVENFAA